MSMSVEEVEARVRALEAELQKATERSRLAKRAVKSAKALAKEAKKEKRQARKALIAVQAEHEAALNAQQEIAQPEIAVRKVRLPVRKRAKTTEVTTAASPMDSFPRSPGEGQDGGV